MALLQKGDLVWVEGEEHFKRYWVDGVVQSVSDTTATIEFTVVRGCDGQRELSAGERGSEVGQVQRLRFSHAWSRLRKPYKANGKAGTHLTWWVTRNERPDRGRRRTVPSGDGMGG